MKGATLGGGVDPDYRRRGIGRRLLQWTEARAPAGAELTIRNEALTVDAYALYLSRGFEPRMVETRMVRDATAPVPDVPAVAVVETSPWSNRSAPLFFAAYRASFADRPGFPDPPAEQWIEEVANGALHADVARVALAAGEPVGFATVRLASGAVQPNGLSR
jgi:hypothetical protein